jgi:hypothetical protein
MLGGLSRTLPRAATRLAAIALSLLVITSSFTGVRGLPAPALSLDHEAHSARNFMTLEREFVKRHLFDAVYDGAYLSVDGKGNVIDPSKNLIFQANVILFLAGMSNDQESDPETTRYVDSAAQFIVRYLKWGADGPGNWYSSSNRTGSNPQEMSWLAPSEAYVS